MADQVNEDTFEWPLLGRVLVLKKSTDAQLMLLRRYVSAQQVRLAQAPKEELPGIWTALYDKTLNVIESRFVSAEDLEFVQDQIMLGNIKDLFDLMPILSNGVEAPTPLEDDADPPTKLVKKAAKKPVKKTTNARRATQ